MRRKPSLDEYNILFESVPNGIAVVLYSDIPKNAILKLRDKYNVSIDKLEFIDSLVTDTLLGVCPASEFRDQLLICGIEKDKVDEIVDFLSDEIFEKIRDEEYDETIGDIPETSYSEEEVDPYRESIPFITDKRPIIESEHLTAGKEQILNEMFSASAPKIKELTKEDGSIIKPLDETPQVNIFDNEKEPEILPDEVLISEQIQKKTSFSSLTERFLNRRKENQENFAGKDDFEKKIEGQEVTPVEIKIEDTTRKPTITLKISKAVDEDKKSEQIINKDSNTIILKIHKVQNEDNKVEDNESKKTEEVSDVNNIKSVNIDPYRELI